MTRRMAASRVLLLAMTGVSACGQGTEAIDDRSVSAVIQGSVQSSSGEAVVGASVSAELFPGGQCLPEHESVKFSAITTNSPDGDFSTVMMMNLHPEFVGCGMLEAVPPLARALLAGTHTQVKLEFRYEGVPVDTAFVNIVLPGSD